MQFAVDFRPVTLRCRPPHLNTFDKVTLHIGNEKETGPSGNIPYQSCEPPYHSTFIVFVFLSVLVVLRVSYILHFPKLMHLAFKSVMVYKLLVFGIPRPCDKFQSSDIFFTRVPLREYWMIALCECSQLAVSQPCWALEWWYMVSLLTKNTKICLYESQLQYGLFVITFCTRVLNYQQIRCLKKKRNQNGGEGLIWEWTIKRKIKSG